MKQKLLNEEVDKNSLEKVDWRNWMNKSIEKVELRSRIWQLPMNYGVTLVFVEHFWGKNLVVWELIVLIFFKNMLTLGWEYLLQQNLTTAQGFLHYLITYYLLKEKTVSDGKKTFQQLCHFVLLKAYFWRHCVLRK